MAESATYPLHPRSTIRRKHDRGAYDYLTVHSILRDAPILHISFLPSDISDDPFPTTLPMIGAVASFSNPNADPASEILDIYVHAHSASRLMKLPSSSPHATDVADDEDGSPAVPVCVCATLIDGFVLALTPFNHSCNYRSAIVHGYASVVTDEPEKNFALHRITDSVVPQRWDNTRVPPSKAEITSTSVLKIKIESASAKIHVGGPGDDRKDLKDENVTENVWTGVLPVYQVIGDAIPGENNKVQKVPEYIGTWRSQSNLEAEKYAREAALVEEKKKKR
ncbi:flavin-nucleotide-binding protein [Xylona heveae TC161]|uniref:Flavin-nucleotide-binding protein n=1 Tax=Xylona heveae (strain CBS 132557 / TC161) TaxID=1328760 RepID=A0A165GIS0_XYLHT|nr:flavin-nucleotide-binding protein [Xylona heveae TC161]KZF22233.1 flavin-nucleotide-binding protein [Xylona heveae TC161]